MNDATWLLHPFFFLAIQDTTSYSSNLLLYLRHCCDFVRFIPVGEVQKLNSKEGAIAAGLTVSNASNCCRSCRCHGGLTSLFTIVFTVFGTSMTSLLGRYSTVITLS